MTKSPIRPTNDEARTLAANLLKGARHAALGVLDPDTGSPAVSRISFALSPEGHPVTLISSLAFHTRALSENPECSLLVGDVPTKGDPLAFPRITLACRAQFVDRALPLHKDLRNVFLSSHPKSKLYIDFADFGFVTFEIVSAALNGGFGKAFLLTPDDFS